MDADRMLELPESRWVDVRGPVHYLEWPGPADAPTFVCLHGLGGSLLNWALVAPGLAERARVLAVDLAGFGLTPPAGRRTGVGANWKLLDEFLRAMELGPAILVGNSMGGMIAMIEAAHAPERVHALVLADAVFPRTTRLDGQFRPRTSALFAIYNSRRLGLQVLNRIAARLGPEGLVREALRVSAADPSSIDPRLVQAIVELTATRNAFEHAGPAFIEAAQSIFQAQVRPARFRALVRAIPTPALVVHGALDQLVPVGAAVAAAASHPNWKLVVFDDLGHVPQMEAPERFLDAVRGWLGDYVPAALRRDASDSSIA
jgi:pimeloyl-ACP methyl ester carboxylesterase